MSFLLARPHLAVLMLLAAFGVVACDGGTVDDTDGGLADATTDVLIVDLGPPDMGQACESMEECDDGIECTNDSCDRGFCTNRVDLTVCSDDIFCNGVEQCDLVRGCVPGPPESCNDDDVCTIDTCDEESKSCMHGPRDFDEDGEADWHCTGGTDCDDTDPARGGSVAEICADTVDNNCNDSIDEMPCGRPPNDDCSDALDISAGGTFEMTTIGTMPDFTLSCASRGAKDVVTTFTLTEAKDVTIEGASSSAVVALSLLDACGVGAVETECRSGFPGSLRRRNLAPGTYFVAVSTSSPSDVVITADFAEATEAPSNETCSMPLDVSAGGHFAGSFVDVTHDVTLSCNAAAAGDLVYTFTIAEEKDVTVRATSPGGETLVGAIRSTCEGTDLRCTGGAPLSTTMHSLAAGTYFIVVEGPTYVEVDFDLEVTFEAPTPPPAGDTCATAIPLTLGMTTLGLLSDKQDDIAISCGYQHADAVYSFTLDATKDVIVTVDGGTRYMNGAITSMCGAGTASELRCISGSPATTHMRNLPSGTYYVIVESYGGSSFQISVDAMDPTMLMPVSGNDLCGTAVEVPETGGFYSGDTSGLNNDYTGSCGSMAESRDATFKLVLTETRRVTASTSDAAFDTVLLLQSDPCGAGHEIQCDDDGGSTGSNSMIDRTLSPGTYYFIVDGFGTGSAGTYYFEVLISDVVAES